tara:strand:- start:311 stop:1099 length:789 start_codon:yes stop_codon:yes gene_type:complete
MLGRIDNKIKNITDLFKVTLGSNLVGVYLHGSLAMGLYNPETSDIDILVVVKTKIEPRKKRILVENLLDIEDKNPKNDVEMSIILESDIIQGNHPMYFDLHYSKLHKDDFLQTSQVCQGGEDPDLICHLAMTKARGKRLHGRPIGDLGIVIEVSDFIDSVLNDLVYNENELMQRPEYIILNICRTLRYLYDKTHCSKIEGGMWAITKHEGVSASILNEILKKYKGANYDLTPYGKEIHSLAERLLNEVLDQVKKIQVEECSI